MVAVSERDLVLMLSGARSSNETHSSQGLSPEEVRRLNDLFPRVPVTGGEELWGVDNLDLEFHALSRASAPHS